jgi:hypothetical protein
MATAEKPVARGFVGTAVLSLGRIYAEVTSVTIFVTF